VGVRLAVCRFRDLSQFGFRLVNPRFNYPELRTIHLLVSTSLHEAKKEEAILVIEIGRCSTL